MSLAHAQHLHTLEGLIGTLHTREAEGMMLPTDAVDDQGGVLFARVTLSS